MIDVDGALAAIARTAFPEASAAERSARVPLARARGHVLAEDLRLPRDQPGFDRATMDGFAVALVAGRTGYRLVGAAAAGAAFTGALAPGEAVKITTGAPTPAGATVVPYEVARVTGDAVECEPAALAPKRNIAWRGEDGRAGDVVATAGTVLTPAVIAVAAGCGLGDVAVRTAPRIPIVTTGDEVGAGGDAGIADTNGPYLAAFCDALGFAAGVEHAPDRADALRAALQRAMQGAVVIITSGGVSGSDADLVAAGARDLGFTPIFHGVAMQPGKPVLFARDQQGRVLIGLPGNPVGLMAAAHVLLLPLLDRVVGARRAWRSLPLAAPVRNPAKRRQFRPARLVDGGVRVLAWNGSGDFLAAACGDGFADLAPQADLAQGAPVRFLPYVGALDGGVVAPALARTER